MGPLGGATLFGQQLLDGQRRSVLGSQDLVRQAVQGVANAQP
jgi:hypothetical protein